MDFIRPLAYRSAIMGHEHMNWTQIGCTNNDLLFIHNTAHLCPIPVAINTVRGLTRGRMLISEFCTA